MPKSAVFTVTTTAAVVVAANRGDQIAHLHSSSGTLYIGGSDLTVSNGYRLDNGDKLTVEIGDNEALYAMTSSGTANLYVLSQVN